jgi:hypothetical protein
MIRVRRQSECKTISQSRMARQSILQNFKFHFSMCRRAMNHGVEICEHLLRYRYEETIAVAIDHHRSKCQLYSQCRIRTCGPKGSYGEMRILAASFVRPIFFKKRTAMMFGKPNVGVNKRQTNQTEPNGGAQIANRYLFFRLS